jgi:hypothetical protein
MPFPSGTHTNVSIGGRVDLHADPHSVDVATLAAAVVASLADSLQRVFNGVERRRYIAVRVRG